MRIAAAVLLSLWLLPVAVAQERAPTFGESVDVRLVNVDVFVTDKKGRRVSGLAREDFVLLQDGRPVEITNFSRITDRSRPGGVEKRPAELDTSLASEPLAALSDPQTVVLFIDNSTLTPHHRNRVLADVEAFAVEQMGAGVEFMIAAFNPGLEIVMPLTRDAEAAREALRRISDMPASGLTAITERRRTMELIQDIFELYEEAGPGSPGALNDRQAGLRFDPCVSGWEQMRGAVDDYSLVAGSRLGDVQAGLLGLTRSLGGVPGRKSLLYLSDGLEQRPGIDLYAYLGEICPQRERDLFGFMTRWDGTPQLTELTEYANAHRVTLYALETTGLTGHSAASVEFAAKQFTPSARNDTLRVSNLQSSLFMMADATGGRAFLNSNFPAGDLDRLAEDLDDYYSLGFEPPSGWDGGSHTIFVSLVGEAAKGRRLRYRSRYRAVPEDERLAERTLAALVLGWEDNPLGTEIRIGEQNAIEGDVWEVPVEIVLPPGSLGQAPRESGERRLIRVLMMAEDEKTRRTPMREKLIPIDTARPDGVAAEAVTLIVNMELEPGVYTIAVGVRDEVHGATSFHRAKVAVSPAASEARAGT